MIKAQTHTHTHTHRVFSSDQGIPLLRISIAEYVQLVEKGMFALLAYGMANILHLSKDAELEEDGNYPPALRNSLEKYFLPVTHIAGTNYLSTNT